MSDTTIGYFRQVDLAEDITAIALFNKPLEQPNRVLVKIEAKGNVWVEYTNEELTAMLEKAKREAKDES